MMRRLNALADKYLQVPADLLVAFIFKASEMADRRVTRISRVAHYPIDAADDDTAAA